MSRPKFGAVLCGVMAAVALTFAGGCKSSGPSDSASSPPPASTSLYDRLGGEPAITLVVDEFVARAAADPKVNFTRKGHSNEWDPTPENVAKLKKHLVQFIAQATGGPQKYQGRDMLTAHKGMDISEAEWNAIVADLKASLDKYKVPAKEQGELVAIVATTHDQIVGH